MAELTYEIVYWPASDALKKDLSVCQPVIDILKRHTPHPIFAGVSVESAKFFLVVAWDSTEAHKQLMAHPEYKTMQANFGPLLPEGGTTGPTVLHAHFSGSPLAIFTAPVVEHVFMTPQDGVSLDELRSVLARANARLVEHNIGSGSVMGTMEERPDQIVAVAGWESIEAHHKANAPGGPVGDDIFPEIISKVKMDAVMMEHVSYTKLA